MQNGFSVFLNRSPFLLIVATGILNYFSSFSLLVRREAPYSNVRHLLQVKQNTSETMKSKL